MFVGMEEGVFFIARLPILSFRVEYHVKVSLLNFALFHFSASELPVSHLPLSLPEIPLL